MVLYIVYLASMAVINGAKSVDDVIRTVKSGFMSVMRLTWITSPLAMIIAQKYIPQEVCREIKSFTITGLSNAIALGALLQPAQFRTWGMHQCVDSICNFAHVVTIQSYFTVRVKQARLAAEKKAKEEKEAKGN